MEFVNVIVPLSLSQTYTYKVPEELRDVIAVGMRVVVSFKTTKFYTGIVSAKVFSHPNPESLKSIDCILDEKPIVLRPQLQLWDFISNYYRATLGDVYRAALPSLFRYESETMVSLNQEYDDTSLTDREKDLVKIISESTTLSVDSIAKQFEVKSVLPALKKLADKGVVEMNEKIAKSKKKKRVAKKTKKVEEEATLSPLAELSPAQNRAFISTLAEFQKNQTVLFNGVTSSGKTEIYMHLIEKVISIGQQVLYLVPEIALTTQLASRLEKVFGDRLIVYHSRNTDADRVNSYNTLLEKGEGKIILGVRSSLFLPFKDLGLIIVDEEHDNSYKQFDPAPRYNARNVAIVLAGFHGAKTLLGSATPSIESYTNALVGKYGFVQLTDRFDDILMPDIKVVDLKDAYFRKAMTGHLSDVLVSEIKSSLSRGKQVILFQNRRGYAPYVECVSCGWVPRCPSCDVSMTYHKRYNASTCHYCGYSVKLFDDCPSCGGKDTLKTKGFGTEQIEEELTNLFPDKVVDRFDFDTTKTKSSFERLIKSFENNKIDILVGTQMISKGMDFANVELVGVLNADNLLNYPDFRANERAFQMLVQVSGRCGRKGTQGKVYLQTYQPNHPIIEDVKSNNYKSMYDREMSERSMFKYPPYFKLIKIILRHKEESKVNRAADRLGYLLRELFFDRVLGPDKPPVGRVQTYYIKHLIVKMEVEYSQEQTKKTIDDISQRVLKEEAFKGLRIALDVDPV